jgi:hypothetical protein
MGDDYNHSTFIDLVLSGLFGLRGSADGVVEIDPFDSDRRLYHALRRGHYGKGKGLLLYVDGKVVASSPTIGKLTAVL